MYHVSAQGMDECMINVYYYYYSAQGMDERMKNVHYYYYYMDCSNTSVHGKKVCLSLCTAKYPCCVTKYSKVAALLSVHWPTLFALGLVISNSTSTHLVWLQRGQRYRTYIGKHSTVLHEPACYPAVQCFHCYTQFES